MNHNIKKKFASRDLFLFIIPSLIGVLIFMTPIKYAGEYTIPVAVLSNLLLDKFIAIIPTFMTIFICLTGLGTLMTKLFKPSVITKNGFLNNLFNVSPFWMFSRLMGLLFVVLTYFQIGPQWIWSENTGGLLLYDLLPILFSVFLFAGFFLPLLLDFGLLEFFGALLNKIMRPIFSLPGRSSIDCITSWLGDGTIGVLLTSKQYEDGYYTKREASVIATTFSAVSITFSLVVISQVNLAHLFIPFYLTVSLAGVVAAIIVPRIPPLSRKSDDLFGNAQPKNNEKTPTGYNSFSWGVKQAVDRAAENNSMGNLFIGGSKNVIDMWLGVTPIVMAFGTMALIVAEFTSVFQWLGMPFIPLLKLLQVPEAAMASQTFIIGFADMFLPSVIGSTIQSELTRFVIACVSVTQLIYMSEVGGLILGSKIPISFKELFMVFIERTLVTLPIIVLVAHIIF
ncbi:YjiH family protein [Irregularibacter muris]|uniref:YjiH family protein n=1 Tax=Irregularibacter muris TaxID=1796619 RepID=A0AAE3HG54_9FIRM|nr:YjiH family protein [Irregularibacter muris]MCR1900025.1 YjiH family protein [Irregularibacter muris]